MPVKIAIDFGTSNTVVAAWDSHRQEGLPLFIPDFSRLANPSHPGLQQGEPVWIIPSLIHYAAGGQRWVGNQVLERGLYRSTRTFRWMKRYILNRSPLQVQIDDQRISPHQAGHDFLTSVLVFAAAASPQAAESLAEGAEIALTVPVEAFEHYENWLVAQAQSAHLPRIRLIDEPSAAALGYGLHIQAGDIYLVFDFGGGTLDISVVRVETEDLVQGGRYCRVLGKAGTDLGGTTLDQWLFQEILRLNGRSDADPDIRPISTVLLAECERVKEALSSSPQVELSIPGTNGKPLLAAAITQTQFEELLDRNEAFTRLERALRRALNASRERGYGEDDLKGVLMVGGSSQVPAVKRFLERLFGRQRVRLNRPLDAIARGAAAFAAGVNFYDHIQHDYAIRHFNRQKNAYDYHLLIHSGTPYPAWEPLARLTVKATQDYQALMGISIYELSAPPLAGLSPAIELVFDPTGAARLYQPPLDETERRARFWMNEANPTFLKADPPAQQGEACFEVEFFIDENKRLLLSARDLRRNEMVYRHAPVVQLV